jgi:hypothetical protein
MIGNSDTSFRNVNIRVPHIVQKQKIIKKKYIYKTSAASEQANML